MKPLAVYLKYGLLLVGLAGIGLYLFVGPPSPNLTPELVGMMSGSPKAIVPFQLVDHGSKPFTLESLKGRWSLLFFGYTHCPDICPTAMEDMKEIFAVLEKTSPNTHKAGRGVFISVDPKRDSLETMGRYVTFFNKDFLGVTGTEEALAGFSRQLGAGYRIIPGKGKEDYMVAHTSNFYLIDPFGQFITFFGAPHDPAAIAAKWTAIRVAYGEMP